MNVEKEELAGYFGMPFCRHGIEVRLGRLFRRYREYPDWKNIYELITQAVLEICDDIRTYGPIEVIRKSVGKDEESLAVLYDGCYVYVSERKGTEMIIMYIRENDIRWMHELCRLASAHYDLLERKKTE